MWRFRRYIYITPRSPPRRGGARFWKRKANGGGPQGRAPTTTAVASIHRVRVCLPLSTLAALFQAFSLINAGQEDLEDA